MGELAAKITSKVPSRRCREMAHSNKTEDEKWMVGPVILVAAGDGAMEHYTNSNRCQRFHHHDQRN